jgi:osmoprotectant transport system substrate-binding protein
MTMTSGISAVERRIVDIHDPRLCAGQALVGQAHEGRNGFERGKSMRRWQWLISLAVGTALLTACGNSGSASVATGGSSAVSATGTASSSALTASAGSSSRTVGSASSSTVTTSGGASAASGVAGPTPTIGPPAANCAVGGGANGNGATVRIGSKAFAEEELLATMTQLVLQQHGFTVTYTTKAADPVIDQALRSGSIDMLWQYTGTELQQFLNVDTPPTNLDAAFNLAAQKDAANNLCWVAPAPMDDTNGLAIKASDQATFGGTLSQFGTYLAAHPDTKVCIMSEFRTRPDGLPGLEKTYGGGYSTANYVDIGSTAEAPIAGGQCAAGEVFTTDSAIAANNLYVLQDDKALFPPDNAGLIVRADVLKKNPAIADLMAPVAAKLTTAVMVDLNKQVEVDKKNVTDVARAWLTQNGFL